MISCVLYLFDAAYCLEQTRSHAGWIGHQRADVVTCWKSSKRTVLSPYSSDAMCFAALRGAPSLSFLFLRRDGVIESSSGDLMGSDLNSVW